MKLSEAILVGSALYPQGKGHIISGYMGKVSVCALGAALAAHGVVGEKDGVMFCPRYPLVQLGEIYPFLSGTDLCERVMTLNDDCHYSINELVEYVKEEEEKHPEWYAENKENNGSALQTEQLETATVSG